MAIRKTALERCEELAGELESGAAVELEAGIEGCIPACVWSRDGSRKLVAARGATRSKAAAALLKAMRARLKVREEAGRAGAEAARCVVEASREEARKRGVTPAALEGARARRGVR